jgi:hypothetical protein
LPIPSAGCTSKSIYLLILHFEIDVKRLSEAGKKYPWPRLERCPECGGIRIWGHGYVERYFEGYALPLWMKRYRCVDCKSVHTARPRQYYRRFQVESIVIILSFLERIVYGKWLKCLSRQRQQYWWKGFLKQACRDAAVQESHYAATLKRLLEEDTIVSSHSLDHFKTNPIRVTPYRTFAVTSPTGFG